MADNTNDSAGFFGGLKKFLFKDEEPVNDPVPVPQQPPAPAGQQQQQQPPPLPASYLANEHKTNNGTADQQMRTKAYQLLESINQPGCDFLEVWNAAEENGGATAQNIRLAFNALKYADKTLTKEKIMTTGVFYAGELQKALDADLAKKTAQRQQLDTEKQQQRKNLSDAVTATEEQIAALQQTLTDKRKQLAELDAGYEPKIADLEQKMETGKSTINAMILQMRSMLSLVEREL